MQGMID